VQEVSEINNTNENKRTLLRLVLAANQLPNSKLPPEPLHHDNLTFCDLVAESDAFVPAPGDNTAWARYHQSLISYVSWNSSIPPTVNQIWNLTYALFTLHPNLESFRLELDGTGKNQLSEALQATGLASSPAKPSRLDHATRHKTASQVSISRSAFWQGAASPFGSRPAWVAHPDLYSHLITKSLTLYPAFPYEHTLTFSTEGRPVHAQHPVRPPKPKRGAVIYSRYVPHLDEFFSMVHLDWYDEKHLRLFHEWQNDPRVAAGWNETGTLEQHRDYLRKMDEDPHQMAILARFNDTFFAYFEVYWAKVCHSNL
jgi:hypothetical protein